MFNVNLSLTVLIPIEKTVNDIYSNTFLQKPIKRAIDVAVGFWF